MYKIAVLGDPDSVLGFTVLGLKAVPVYDEADAKKKFREISLSGEYAVIYVTDNYYQCLSEQIDRFLGTAGSRRGTCRRQYGGRGACWRATPCWRDTEYDRRQSLDSGV